MTDLFETEIESGSECGEGHALKLVAEGFALCRGLNRVRQPCWFAWRLTPPTVGDWGQEEIVSADRLRIPAWVALGLKTKPEALAFIQADIEAHRNLPFDEERERARLMPV